MTRLYGLLAAAALLLITGCASLPMTHEAGAFEPPPGKGALYIFRDEVFGAAAPMKIWVNGHLIGRTEANTYFRLVLDPGRYRIESRCENVSALSLTVSADESAFVWQEVKTGMWLARSLLQQVDDKRGRRGVGYARRIEASLPDEGISPLDSTVNAAAADRLAGAALTSQEGCRHTRLSLN